MPATKPTSNGAVTVQTGHANYANLVRCFSFLDGSGTSVTDHMSAGNLTLSIDGAGGGWQTSTVPYGFTMAHNDGVGNSTHWTGSHTYTANPGFTIFARVKIDSIDPTSSYMAPIVGGAGYAHPWDLTSGVNISADANGDINAHVEDSTNGRRSDIDYTYSSGTWVTLALRYDYAANSNAGRTYLFADGVLNGVYDTSQDRPGQFGSISSVLNSGKHEDAATLAGWSGEWDVLYVYDTPLSDSDIAALHADPYAVIAAASTPAYTRKNLLLMGVS